MNQIIYQPNYWYYLKGDFLNRVHNPRLRKAVKILMAVVIGALVLGGLYLLFSGTILPTLTERIQSMFNYSG